MMKSILKISLTTLLLLGTLHAEEKAVTMRTMLDAMNLIQLGLLTNTKVLVKEGVFELENSKNKLGTVDHSRYLSFDEVQGYAYTKEKVDQLGIEATRLQTFFKAGDTTEALQAYNSIMLQCVECHTKLRDYKDEGIRFR